jgi:DMSO/TMAO reductase YedYZ molybdopterin-dependent catalytic subunit
MVNWERRIKNPMEVFGSLVLRLPIDRSLLRRIRIRRPWQVIHEPDETTYDLQLRPSIDRIPMGTTVADLHSFPAVFRPIWMVN